jgi:hypothetical protein
MGLTGGLVDAAQFGCPLSTVLVDGFVVSCPLSTVGASVDGELESVPLSTEGADILSPCSLYSFHAFSWFALVYGCVAQNSR